MSNLYVNPQNSAKSADGSHLTHVSDEEMQVQNGLQWLAKWSVFKREKKDHAMAYQFLDFTAIEFAIKLPTFVKILDSLIIF